MRHVVIAATAAVALVAGAFAASAQQDEEKQRPQAQGQSKQPKQSPSASDKGGSAEQKQPDASAQGREPKATDKGSDRAQREKRQEPGSKSVQERDREPAKSQDKSTAEDKSEPTKKGTAERKDEGTQKKGTAEREDDAQKKGTAERKDDDGQKKGPAAAGKDSPDQDKKQALDSKNERVELSQEQRTRVRTTIREQNVKRVTNVNFSINVGVHVPRTVTLHALPRTVVEVVPYYRGYRYFAVEDRICIVDPATYEIVYVIDESGPPSHTARLELSASQRSFILSQLNLDRPGPDVRVRLALGAEIPSQVELLAFPDPVTATIPDIRAYRYVIVDRSVAIVDPDDRDVVLLIER